MRDGPTEDRLSWKRWLRERTPLRHLCELELHRSLIVTMQPCGSVSLGSCRWPLPMPLVRTAPALRIGFVTPCAPSLAAVFRTVAPPVRVTTNAPRCASDFVSGKIELTGPQYTGRPQYPAGKSIGIAFILCRFPGSERGNGGSTENGFGTRGSLTWLSDLSLAFQPIHRLTFPP